MRFILTLIMLAAFGVVAYGQHVNLNDWDRDFTKLSTETRDDVMINLYRHSNEPNAVYYQLVNRKVVDVKVNFEISKRLTYNEPPIHLVAYIHAGGVWPKGRLQKVVGEFNYPQGSVRAVTEGIVEESEETEIAQDGSVAVRYRYSFKTIPYYVVPIGGCFLQP